MKRFTLWGTSFAKLGDEAQIVATCQLLKSVYGSIDVVLLDRERTKTRDLYPWIRTIRVRHAWSSILRIARSDALIVIGAPFFESPRQVLHCLFIFAVAKIFRRPILCHGVTLFDYGTSWGGKFYAFLLNRVDRLAIRERIGTDIAKRIGVKNCFHLITDPRCILEPAPEADATALMKDAGIDPGRPLVGITTRYMDETIPEWVKRNQDFSSEANKRANAIIGQIVSDFDDRAQVLIIPMHKTAEEDAAMATIIHRHCSMPKAIKILARDVSALECMAVISQCDMIISSRLASSVLGAASATPTFSIAYDARMTDFVCSIDAQDHVVQWKMMDGDLVLAMVRDMWDNREKIRVQMQQMAERLRQAVWRESRLLDVEGNFEYPEKEDPTAPSQQG